MMKRFFIFSCILLLSIPSLHAGIWVSAGVPAGFSWTSSGTGAYSHDAFATTNPTGSMVHLKLPGLPVMGYTKVDIEVAPVDQAVSDKTRSKLSLEMMELLFELPLDSVNFLLGYGWGFAKFTCGTADCEDLTFDHKESHQFTGVLGVPLWGGDFHITGRRVFGKIRVGSGDEAQPQVFTGFLTGFGFRIGF